MAQTLVIDIQPRAQSALAASPIYDLRNLAVKQQEDTLLISGVVSSFYHKQLAQEVIWVACDGCDFELINLIQVL